MNGRVSSEDGMKMIKFSKHAARAVLMAGCLVLGALGPVADKVFAATDPVEVDHIVAVVNSEVITARELNERVDLAVR